MVTAYGTYNILFIILSHYAGSTTGSKRNENNKDT